jgi:hypothetical protein
MRRSTTILEPNPRIQTPTGRYSFLRALSNKTAWLVTNEIDPLIRDTVARWDQDGNTAHMSWVTRDTKPVPDARESGDRTAVDMIEELSVTLRLPVSSIVNATGIAPRTFYDWKRATRHPRVKSFGQLWSMAQLVEDLATVHQDVAKWLHARPAALESLIAGDFDAVGAFDLRQRSVVSPRQTLEFESVGPEPDLPLTRGTPLSELRRVKRSTRHRRSDGDSVSE